MTRHRLDGRSYNHRIGKPYYGSALKRIIAPEPEEPESIIERITNTYDSMSLMEIRLVVCCVILAVFMAAVIVVL